MGTRDTRRAGRALLAETRGVSSTEYLSLAAFGALAVATAFAAFGDALGGGLFPGDGSSTARFGDDGRGAGVGGPAVAGSPGALSGRGGDARDPGAGFAATPPMPESTGGGSGTRTLPSGEPSGGSGSAGRHGAAGETRGGPSARPGDSGADRGGAVHAAGRDAPSRTRAGEAFGGSEGAAVDAAGHAPPLPEDREAAAEVLSRYGAVAGSDEGDVGAIGDAHLEGLIEDEALPPELRKAAAIERAHRDEASECSGWFSTCKLKEVAKGSWDFVSGVGVGVGRGAWYTGKFVAKAGEYAARLGFETSVGYAFGYTPTLDKVKAGAKWAVDNPKQTLETGVELAKVLGAHVADLARQCSTEYTARGCGETVGEVGFDVGLTLLTGGAGGAAKGAAKVGAVASRHGASRTATALRHAERGLRRADDAGRAARAAIGRGAKGAARRGKRGLSRFHHDERGALRPLRDPSHSAAAGAIGRRSPWAKRIEERLYGPIPAEARAARRLDERWAAVHRRADRVRERLRRMDDHPAVKDAWNRIDEARMSPSETASRLPEFFVTANKRADIARDNWHRADRLTTEWANRGEPITVDRIRELNRILGDDLPHNGAAPGTLRGAGQEITAGGDLRRMYAPGSDVDVALKRFEHWMHHSTASGMPPIEQAGRAYQSLVTIHPFFDGNGRTSRMVMDWILKRDGLPPAAIDDTPVALFEKLDGLHQLEDLSGPGAAPAFAADEVRKGVERSLSLLEEASGLQ